VSTAQGLPQESQPRRQPRNHAVHFYADEGELVDAVAGFARDGLASGDSVVLVATAPHLTAVEEALRAAGHDVADASRHRRLIALDAAEALDRFMVAGAPDVRRFAQLFEPCLDAARAASGTSRVRAYGEMVDVLWTRGSRVATLQLENLWCATLDARPWCTLLCGYLLEGFSSDEHATALREVANAHGVVLPSRRHTGLTPDQRTRRLVELERRALALEREMERRRKVEAERACLLEAESKARAEIALLYRITEAANRAESLDEVYEAALGGIASALGVDRASILLFDPDGVMRFKAWRGLSPEYRAGVEGHSPWRSQDKRPAPVLVEDARADAALAPFLPILEREEIRALGFFPLFSRGRLKGKFMVYYRAQHPFTDEERRIAGAIADQIAFAVSRHLASQERDRFLGIVGHDLRNPLSAVTMSAAALQSEALPGRAGTLVQRIVKSAQRMDGLITELLDFARARDATGFPIQRTPCNLADIARRVLDELEAGRPAATASLRAQGDTRGEWDGDRVAQVLSNLVANAMQHGTGAVDVSLRAEGDEVVADVHNDGEPIPPGALPSLFDPFRRGRSASTENHLGLGLFISREIVRAHGGTIAVRSSAAEGTTFSVRLPRAARPA
jgi:signal transduction histidine kinase